MTCRRSQEPPGPACGPPAALTVGHGGHLVLQRQDQLGLPREVPAAALLVLQHRGDAPGQRVQAADDRRVRVGLRGRAGARRPHAHSGAHGRSGRRA